MEIHFNSSSSSNSSNMHMYIPVYFSVHLFLKLELKFGKVGS